MAVKALKRVKKDAAPSFLSGGGEMGALMRSMDWSHTALGAPARWPQALKTAVSLMLGSRHPMWIGWERQGLFLYNDAYLSVLGAAKHPWALGRPVREVWAEIWEQIGPLYEKVFDKAEASFVDDVRLFMRRGDFLEETFYSFSYSPIRDDSGAVLGLFCPSTEVTSKILNTRRLSTLSELTARALAEKDPHAAAAIAMKIVAENSDDIPFALLYLPEGGQVALKAAAGPPGASRFGPATIALDDERAPWPVAQVLRTGQEWLVPLPGTIAAPKGPAGQPVTQALVAPLKASGQEQAAGAVVLAINPTRRLDPEYRAFFTLVAGQTALAIANARAYAEASQRADTLAELDRAKTAFFSNVSHEFRTPLTLMLGPLEDALAENHTARERERLELMHRNALRLQKLTNSLLDFSRIEAGRMQANFVPTDLPAYTRELASNFRSACERVGLSLIVDCPVLATPAYVDRAMWEKIVLNLLSNALKFTFHGQIAVALSQAGGQLRLTVRDTGEGIAPAELPRLFERFYRAANVRARSHEGTGIGLALTRELARLHGGDVKAESRPGKGSCFTVTMPLGRAHLPAEQVERAPPSPGPGEVSAFTLEALGWEDAPGPSFDPVRGELVEPRPSAGSGRTAIAPPAARPLPRVLIADDNKDMRDYLARLLGARYAVTAVADGAAALREIRRQPPDLVLSDVMMPRLDGFGLIRALGAEPAGAGIPVILLSARAGEEARIEGMQAGADDYLVKPFAARELVARIDARLEIAALRKEAQSRLRASEAKFATAFSATPVGLAITAVEPVEIIEANDALIEFFGYPREEMLGRSPAELGLWVKPGQMAERLALLQAGRKPPDLQTRFRRKNGQEVVGVISTSPMEIGGRPCVLSAVADVTERVRAESALASQKRVFEMIAADAALPQVLDALCEAIEQQSASGAIATVLLTDDSGSHLRSAAGRRCPQPYAAALGAVPFGASEGSCGTAAFRRETVVVPDIAADPLWAAYRGLALANGLAACWSTPILSAAGTVLGTFAVYHPTPRAPQPQELAVLEVLAQTGAFAIERHQAQAALRASEAKFAAAFAQAPTGITITSLATGKLIDINDALLAFNGYTREEAIGRSPDELGMWVEPKLRQERFARLAAGESVPAIEARFRKKNGEEATAIISSAPVFIAGQPCVLSAVVDVTDRVRAENAMRESESRFRHMADHAPMMVWVTEPDARCSYLSKSWYEFTGQTPATGLGFGWLDAVHPDDGARSHDIFIAANAKHEAFRLEYRLRRHDGTYRWAIDAASPRFAADGRFLGYVGSVVDIHERRQTEDTLRKAEGYARFLVALNAATAPLTDADEIMAVAARLLGQHLNAGRCMYAEVAGDEDTFDVVGDYTKNVRSMVGRWRMSAFGEVMHGLLRAGKNWVLTDAASDARVTAAGRETYRAAEIVSGVVVPLHKHGRLSAGLAVQDNAVRVWSEDEVALIEQVAHRCWESIERARAQRRVVDSEARARLALEIARQGTWSWETATDTLKADARMREMLSLPREGPVRFTESMARLHPDDVALAERTVREALNGGGDGRRMPFQEAGTRPSDSGRRVLSQEAGTRPSDSGRFSVELRVVHPDGGVRWILSRGQMQFAGEGAQRQPRLLLGSALDITERKTTEEALRESEARARLALDVAAQGTFTWNPASGAIEADARFRELFGLKPRGPLRFDEALNRIHPEHRGRMQQSLDAALAADGEGRIIEEIHLVQPDGSERWIAVSGQTLFTGAGGGKAPLMVGSVLDITERRRTEHALREADRRKDEFLATLAHELRNPLAPLRNSLHVLRLSRGAEPLHEMMERQVNHMVRLVDDLLEISRISRGKIELKKERVELHHLVENVLQATQPQIEAARHKLGVTLPPEPLLLDADPVRLSQVLTNLLNNAVKYTPPGGRIWLTALRDEGHLALSVRDNGAGIPKEMLSRVFDMFTQVDRTIARAQGGLGIGLALARNLVEMHGGRISARSDGPGQGSEFTIRMPLAAERRAGPREPVAVQVAAALQPKRILVVDDNRDAADSLAMLLKFLGAEAQVAHDGPAALKLLDSFAPAVILLDLGMPGMDGFEVARQVRARRADTVTLIALTGWGQDEDRARTRNAGFDHHLIKPPDISALQAVLTSMDEPKAGGNPAP